MTAIFRVRSNWTGFPGAPGYTNMYFTTTDPLAASATGYGANVKAFWEVVKTWLPSNVTITVDPIVPVLDDADGKVFQEVQMTTAPAASVGGSAGVYAAASGTTISWSTASYRDGRRVKGRTYLVPLHSSAFDASGTLTAGCVTSLTGAGSGLISSSGHLVVFSRPREETPAKRIDGKDAIHARVGASFPVTTASVRDFAAVLTSRRD